MSDLKYTPACPGISAEHMYSPIPLADLQLNGIFDGKEYEFTGEFRPYKTGEVFRNNAGYLRRATYTSAEFTPRLIFRPVKKYRFVLESLTPRIPKAGEWHNRYSEIKESEDFAIDRAAKDFQYVKCLIFTREEVTE